MIATLTTLKVIWMLVSLAAVIGFGLWIGFCLASLLGFHPTFNVRRKTKLAAETQRHGDITDGLGSAPPRLCGKSSSPAHEDDAICRDILRSQEDLQP